MTALQLIIINIVICGGVAALVYALTHGSKKSHTNKTQH
jgi:hypothetical protein